MGIIGTVISAIAGWAFIGIAAAPVLLIPLWLLEKPYTWLQERRKPKGEPVPVTHKDPENTGIYCIVVDDFAGPMRKLSTKKCICTPKRTT
ncbi:hypothetical protein OHB54_13640 [Streptomyces sp. NBC_01007]|nr:hypothetical protein OHB54_13640 [Streptomyces sp. NBC_01007]